MPLLQLYRPSIWEPPTLLQHFLLSPLNFTVYYTYHFLLWLRGAAYQPPSSSTPSTRPKDSKPSDAKEDEKPWSPAIRVVCISDTHTRTFPPSSLPAGDILIHSGDLTNEGTISEISAQLSWLSSLTQYTHKIVIAGNHDSYFDPRTRKSIDRSETSKLDIPEGITYLQHSGVTLSFPPSSTSSSGRAGKTRTLKIHGSPQIPMRGSPTGDPDPTFAFTHHPELDAWTGTIPLDTDILITHGPAAFHSDIAGRELGDRWLLKELWRVQPRLHVFGHVHANGGSDAGVGYLGTLEETMKSPKQGESKSRNIEALYFDKMQFLYEKILSRGNGGLLRDLFPLMDPFAWIDAVRIVACGVKGIIWSRVWGGGSARGARSGRGGWSVNAALVEWRTGVASLEGGRVKVVDL